MRRAMCSPFGTRTTAALGTAGLLAAALAAGPLTVPAGAVPSTAAQPAPVAPTSPGEEYEAMGYGVFLHYGLATELGKTPWQYDPHEVSAKTYNPSDFDPDQWMRAIADSGAKYIVFTTKHHDGFTMWPSAHTDWGVESSSQPNTDVVGEVVRAARAHGLKVVLYYSWHDKYQPGGDVHPRNASSDRRTTSPAYLAYAKNQLTELLTNYGDIAGLWMDIAPMDNARPDSQIQELADHIHQVSPETAFVPNFPSAPRDAAPPADVATFEAGYDAIPCGFSGDVNGITALEQAWTVASGPGWWQTSDTAPPNQNVHQVMAEYHASRGVGATFTLNAPPGPSGRLPEGTVNLLKQVGDRIRSGNTGPEGDPYQVLPDGTHLYDDGKSRCGADDRIHYTGGDWKADAWADAYRGTRHYSRTAGDRAELDFEGSAVTVHAQTRPGHGYVDISVDGGPAERVDTYSATPHDQAVIWHKTGLTPGRHTVRITVVGAHNDDGATNSWVSLDAIRVRP